MGFLFLALLGMSVLAGSVSDDIEEEFTEEEVDQTIGGEGADTLLGSAGTDILSGEGGADSIFGGDGSDLIVGGEGTDVLDGGAGDDFIISGEFKGSDEIARDPQGFVDTSSNADPDIFDEIAPAADTVNGGAGNDFLFLGAGDVATGGGGSDAFLFGDWVIGEDATVITDFDPAEDALVYGYDSTVVPIAPVMSIEEEDDGSASILADGSIVATLPSLPSGLTADQIIVIERT